MQIIQLLFGGMMAHRLLSMVIGLIMAVLIFMLVTDADFVTSAASKIGDIIAGEQGGIVDWIVDYITKIIGMFKANMS